MKNTMILASFLALAPLAKGQLLLEALDAPLQEKFTLPNTWTMEVNNNAPRYLVSVYDNNYLPMNANDLSAQPTTANTTASAPDATNDPLLNYQGKIGHYANNSGSLQRLDIDQAFEKRLYAVNVKFTPRAGSTAAIHIPSTLAEAVIPARYLKNTNQDVKVYLKAWFGDSSSSWKPTTATEITAYIVADREVDLIQLDMNQGIGRDGRGILLTTFDVAGSPLELRLLPGIPDKYAGKKTNSYVAQGANLYEHDMFYMPVNAPAGGTWLSYDLGAYTTNLKHPDFYPLAKGGLTHLSAGSLYQWGRDSDGHELRETPTSTNPKYGTTTGISNVPYPNHSKVITDKTEYGTWFNAYEIDKLEKQLWNSEQKSYLWGRENSLHQPCPTGYNIAKSEQLLRSRWRADDRQDPFHSDNNLYGVLGTGETIYNWIFVGRKSMEYGNAYTFDPSDIWDPVYERFFDGERYCYYEDDEIANIDGCANKILPILKSANRFFSRESRPINRGPILWQNTEASDNSDRAPVRCVKD